VEAATAQGPAGLTQGLSLVPCRLRWLACVRHRRRYRPCRATQTPPPDHTTPTTHAPRPMPHAPCPHRLPWQCRCLLTTCLCASANTSPIHCDNFRLRRFSSEMRRLDAGRRGDDSSARQVRGDATMFPSHTRTPFTHTYAHGGSSGKGMRRGKEAGGVMLTEA
jgi:hypothetical protein